MLMPMLVVMASSSSFVAVSVAVLADAEEVGVVVGGVSGW